MMVGIRAWGTEICLVALVLGAFAVVARPALADCHNIWNYELNFQDGWCYAGRSACVFCTETVVVGG